MCVYVCMYSRQMKKKWKKEKKPAMSCDELR